MIDFHTHILPGIDDGAKSLEESLSLLKMEQEQGVDTIVLTPHYFHERQSLMSFYNNGIRRMNSCGMQPSGKKFP